MLFSEPKIPQVMMPRRVLDELVFQCSSASRKFLNVINVLYFRRGGQCFSALQRAENSSIPHRKPRASSDRRFQCSSASRKFLNLDDRQRRAVCLAGFSALQRAENSSIHQPRCIAKITSGFSALQRAENSSIRPSHLRPSIFPTAMITLRHS